MKERKKERKKKNQFKSLFLSYGSGAYAGTENEKLEKTITSTNHQLCLQLIFSHL